MHTVPDERPPWWRSVLTYIDSRPLVGAWLIFSLTAGAGWAAGYLAHRGECSR